ncbi:FAD binding domain-containing protein [Lasiosphaeria ovina]|uniref:FAD binding domain-containing protein n=1 Tax=Lasiosphaeria ovina TaxID=92902 RepID=A0AAE0JTR9_9PEZI|nr:FAD binding domain-containing protein [Lasiosphaeria ovina]
MLLRRLLRLAPAFLLPKPATASNSTSLPGTRPCDALAAAGLGDILLAPTDSGYEPQMATWWSLNAQLRPWCLVLPRSTAEVSLVLTTLVAAGHGAGSWHIAVRSGGHGWPGSNSVVNGVTIDLSHLNATRYDAAANRARLQPGARWEHAYAALQAQGNVTVAGGRDGGVGVGGFLLGGGISFFSGRHGFGCDSVVNYEVVLADGSVVYANATAHADLWRALKGGAGNFGIVTRYDLQAIPSTPLLYELRYLAANYSSAVVDAVVDYAGRNASYGDDALVTFYSHDVSISPAGDTVIGVIHVNTLGNADSEEIFDGLKELPALVNVTARETMADAAAGSKLPGGTLNAGSTRTFKNNPAILRYCVQLHEQLVASLTQSIGADSFTTLMFLQPIPAYLGRLGPQQLNGGGVANMLGLENMTDGAVIWTGGIGVSTGGEAALAVAQAALNAMSAQVASFAQSVGGLVDLVYLNYADPSQDPLGSYGADNVAFLRRVAAEYDPNGVFQSRVPGGFKISRVG